MDRFLHDLRYALRTLRRSPGFTAVAVATLAIGIGANTTVFSLVDPYLLRDLPFLESDRLVQVYQVDRESDWDEIRLSLPQFRDWQERNRAFTAMAAYDYGARNLTGGGAAPERVQAARMTADMLDVLGVEPLLGRGLTAREQGRGAPRVVLLHHDLWQRRYGGRPDIVGRRIEVDGEPHTVVGVMPPAFNFPFGEVKMWVPLDEDAATAARDRIRFLVVGRLAEGWTAARAERELTEIQGQLAEAHPESDGGFAGVNVVPIREALIFYYDLFRSIFVALLGAAGFFLLLVCVNVAGLMLARASTRGREVAIRTALGAGRGRLIGQFLTESLVLAVLGGAAGVIGAVWIVDLLARLVPEALFRVGDIAVDRGALGYTGLATLGAVLIFGLVPALRSSHADVAGPLEDGGRGGTAGRRGRRLRRALVVAEVGLGLVLVVGAGLMARSVDAMQSVPLGFEPERVLTVELTLPEADYGDPAISGAFYDRAVERLRALPGATAAASVAPLPLNHEAWHVEFQAPGAPSDADHPAASRLHASPGFFETLGIPLLRGRRFTRADDPDAEPVVVINRTLATRHFGAVGDPVGRRLAIGDGGDAREYTVVGVVGDIRHAALEREPGPQIYFPQAQRGTRDRFLVVRTAGPPDALALAVRRSIAGLDPDLPVSMLQPLTDVVDTYLLAWRLTRNMIAVLAAVALFLAALGLYGILAYSVATRTREIGVRLALGARRARVHRMVMGQGLRLVVLGGGIGLALALGLGRALSTVLYGVRPTDPVTFAGVSAAFLAVGLAATYLPARRATRVDPMAALREE